MSRRIAALAGAALLLGAAVALAQDNISVPLTHLKLAPIGGIEAKLEQVPNADGDRTATKVTFKKADEGRRLLALEAKTERVPDDVKSVALRYRAELKSGEARLTALFFDQDGGTWFKVRLAPLEAGEFAESRIAIGSLKQAAYSEDESGELEWGNVNRVWLGLVIDGAAEGTFEVSEARLTDERYRADKPFRVAIDKPNQWSVGNDPAVKPLLTTPNEGPDGQACMKFEFSFPGGRHMYAIPAIPMPPAELEGYSALRFTYKAALPEGIDGLLTMLGERGGAQYYADPAPPATDEWKTITIPFTEFKKGGWSKDPNEQLDLGDVNCILIGLHGAAKGDTGSGTLWVTDVELVP